MGHIAMQPVELKISFETTAYKGVSYQCPHCRSVLGAGVDFLAQKAGIADAVAERLKR